VGGAILAVQRDVVVLERLAISRFGVVGPCAQSSGTPW
jgi:hypothetical protein